nr:trypsin-like peptidase domain-containing protein [Tessaracoccus coleopterorum]
MEPGLRPAPVGHHHGPGPGDRKAPKGRSRIAGILAVAILAGGVGGGVGFAASQLGGGTTTASVGSGGTTVVQADPNSPNWTAVAKVASKAVVAIDVQTSGGGAQGSGVVIDTEGHIVTNNHVVSGALDGKVIVMLGNVSYEATVVGTDPSTDLAVVKLVDPPSDLSVMEFADNQVLSVGDPVMAIGNPLGLADTVTTGIVSALNRPVTTTAASEQQQQLPGFGQLQQQTTAETVVTAAIQTNAAINPGNSGGALVDSSGRLIGITSSIASLSSGQSQSGNIGIGFAIGSDQVRYVADQLISTGRAEHPQLGISASDVRTTGQQGAVVAQVVSGSPAASAGLKVDDLITAVDGQTVTGSESLVALVRAGQVGKAMDLTVLRGGKEVTVTVTPVAAKA